MLDVEKCKTDLYKAILCRVFKGEFDVNTNIVDTYAMHIDVSGFKLTLMVHYMPEFNNPRDISMRLLGRVLPEKGNEKIEHKGFNTPKVINTLIPIFLKALRADPERTNLLEHAGLLERHFIEYYYNKKYTTCKTAK